MGIRGPAGFNGRSAPPTLRPRCKTCRADVWAKLARRAGFGKGLQTPLGLTGSIPERRLRALRALPLSHTPRRPRLLGGVSYNVSDHWMHAITGCTVSHTSTPHL